MTSVVADEIRRVVRAVGHDDRHDVALEQVEPGAHGEPETSRIVREVVADARVLCGERLNDDRGVVSARVVDDEDLVVDRRSLEHLRDLLDRRLGLSPPRCAQG